MLSLAAYAGYLSDNPEEAQDLFGDLLISVTAFFRDSDAFEALAETVIATAVRRSTGLDEPSGSGRWAAPPARRPTASPS